MSTCVSYRNDEMCTREFATLAFDKLMCLLSLRARIQNRPYEYTLVQNCSSHTPLRIPVAHGFDAKPVGTGNGGVEHQCRGEDMVLQLTPSSAAHDELQPPRPADPGMLA
jgi:hypothetical protein